MRLRSLITATFLGVALLALPTGTAAAEPAGDAAAPHCAGHSVFEKNIGGQTLRTAVPTTHHQSYDIGCALSPGDTGDGVRALQVTLNRCYDPALVVDGQFGQATARLLRRLQMVLGVPVDGFYGPRLAKAMDWAWYDAGGQWRTCERL